MPICSVALVGPAAMPLALNLVSLFAMPQKNSKGSINTGGGGGGGGAASACGGPASSEEVKAETGGCGGGGGGCGGGQKAKKKPEKPKFKVIFKDFMNIKIKEEMIECGQAAIPPTFQEMPVYPLYEWNESWDSYDFENVSKDLEICGTYINKITGESLPIPPAIMQNPVTEHVASEVQGMCDMAKQQFDQSIDVCIDTINDVVNTANSVIDACDYVEGAVARSEGTPGCEDEQAYSNIKKCIMNIVSTFMFKTRMMFNTDMHDIIDVSNKNLDSILESARSGKNVFGMIADVKQQIDANVKENLDREAEFRKVFIENLNLYIEDLQKIFPTKTIEKIQI